MRGMQGRALLVAALAVAGWPGAARAGGAVDVIGPLAVGDAVRIRGTVSDADWHPRREVYYQRFVVEAEPGAILEIELNARSPYPEAALEPDDGDPPRASSATKVRVDRCYCRQQRRWEIRSAARHVLWVRLHARGSFELVVRRVAPADPDAPPISRADPAPPAPPRDLEVRPRKPLWKPREVPATAIGPLRLGQTVKIKGALSTADWDAHTRRYVKRFALEGSEGAFLILRARAPVMKPLDLRIAEGNPMTTDSWKKLTADGHAEPDQGEPGWDQTLRRVVADKGYVLEVAMPSTRWNEKVPPGKFELQIERVAPVPPPRY